MVQSQQMFGTGLQLLLFLQAKRKREIVVTFSVFI